MKKQELAVGRTIIDKRSRPTKIAEVLSINGEIIVVKYISTENDGQEGVWEGHYIVIPEANQPINE